MSMSLPVISVCQQEHVVLVNLKIKGKLMQVKLKQCDLGYKWILRRGTKRYQQEHVGLCILEKVNLIKDYDR